MGATAGGLALRAAFAAAIGALALSMLGQRQGRAELVRWGRRSLLATAMLLTVAVAGLAAALLGGDWSLVYVADYTSRDTPWPYRLAALWGGMAGSLLVWAWLLALVSVVAVRWVGSRGGGASSVQAVLAGILAVPVGLSVWASPPFARLAVPAIGGAGLTPVLRHPAMLYHPLLLYAGQVALAVPFALAAQAMVRRLPATAWLPAARRWMLGSLAVLAVAMVAGAHWAYVELGWGGYWAWDPVENGVLLPWLAGLAFCHASLRTGTTGEARLAARLAALTFGFALWGAFLTRSGVTGSVHSFAEAQAVGRGFLALLAAVVTGWLALEWTGRTGVARGAAALSLPGFTRQQALALGTGLLLALTALVAVGSVLPVLWRAVTGDRLVVTGRYFAFATWPLALAVLALVGLGVRLRDRPQAAFPVRLLAPAVAGVPALALSWWWLDDPTPLALSAVGLAGASGGLIAAELHDCGWRLRQSAGLVAHFGAAVLLVGVLAGTTGTHRTAVLDGQQPVSVGAFTFRLEGIEPADPAGPGAAVRAEVHLWRGERPVGTLRPYALVTEPAQRVSVAGLRSTPVEDVLVILRAVGPDGASAVMDVHIRPLAAWVWWGGLLIAAGLALAAAAQTLTISSAVKEEAPAPAVHA